MAAHLVPSEQQLAWQQLELTAFLHFGINTFTDNEWGDGTDSPALFNPTELDCEQWVRTLKEAGFKMVIITAKHHDGFCLWPTATTDYSVANSPWRNGEGDVVRELSEACSRHDMKFGIYLSPWDRNTECYGDSPAYNALFIAQLTELLTNYGRVDEVWFDGACAEGANGRRQEYDWEAILSTIERLQPHAVTAIMGDDVRWVGNEGGLGRITEWSATAFTPQSYSYGPASNAALGIEEMSADLGSRALVARAEQMYWYPSEVDVSIRPGWFYHAYQDDQVRSLSNLVDIYFNSVGCNSVLLLNIPPDRRGLIHEIDAERITQLHNYIATTFANNLVAGRVRPLDAHEGESIAYNVERNSTINTLLIQEDISQGQRIEEFTVEALIDGMWQPIAEGTTIGYKRLLRFEECNPTKIRVTINKCRATAHISNFGLYYAEPIEDQSPTAEINNVTTCPWMCVGMDATEAIDGDLTTSWHAEGLTPIVVDMGCEVEIVGFYYAPTSDDNREGTIFNYNFDVSIDGSEWQRCVTNSEFSNIKHNPIPQIVPFEHGYTARYFRLVPLREIDDRQTTSIGEVGIIVE